nr:NUDIX domain-containing protein [Burkholderia cepacia]
MRLPSRRTRPAHGPRWAIPGSTIKPEESPLEATHREQREETGLKNIPLSGALHFGVLDSEATRIASRTLNVCRRVNACSDEVAI